MSFAAAWLLALFLLGILGELAHVQLLERQGVSPIASAAGVAFMLSIPHRPGAGGIAMVLGGAAAVTIAALIGSAVAEAAGLPTTGIDILGRAASVLVIGVLAHILSIVGVHRSMSPDGRDWIYALAIWLVALVGTTARFMVLALWISRTDQRAFSVALRDELATFGMLSFATSTTAVMIVLSREAVGLWGPVLFLAPLALSIAAARRYAHTRRTYRETIVALSQLTDHVGYTMTDHARRVADVAVALGRRQGLSQRELQTVEYAALLHDLGQVALQEPIPGGATVLAAPRVQEWIAQEGVEILSRSGVLDDVVAALRRQAAPFRTMREEGDRIPLESRIIKVANAFDDLTEGDRDGEAVSMALERIQLGLGYEYDPEIVDDLIALAVSGHPALRPQTAASMRD